MLQMVPRRPSLVQAANPAEERSGFGRSRIERERALDFAPRAVAIARLEQRPTERDPAGHRLAAPQRDLELVDGLRESPAALVDLAEQQVRLVFVRRQIDRAPELVGRLAIAGLLEQPASTF